MSEIRNTDEISRIVAELLRKNLSYQYEEIPFITDFLQECKTKYSGSFQQIKSSSGNSILLIFENFVFKIYNKSYREELVREVNILENLKECKHVVKVFKNTFDNPIVVFEKLKPLKSENLANFQLSDTKKLVSDIAEGLYHIHSKSYVHRDTGHSNICIRETKEELDTYVFIDFENATDFNINQPNLNFQECMYNDVNQFLEDIEIQIRNIDSNKYITKVISELKIKCIIQEQTQIIFLGKTRNRTISKVNYNIGDFLSIINSI